MIGPPKAPSLRQRLQDSWRNLKARFRPRRVRTPIILQMEAVECGATSLAIVLGYYGRFVASEELRAACGVSRDGSKASNIIAAARRYGLKARGFKKKPESLPALPLPLIVFWNFDHFLVVEGFGKDRVYLNDPATGPRVVSTLEFNQSYTGVVLIFKPEPDFVRDEKKPSLVEALRKRAVGFETALTYVVLAGLALVIPSLAIPIFSQIFVDEYLVRGLEDWVVPLLVGMGLTALMRAALTWLQAYHLLRLETKMALTTSSRFFWHLLRLPIEFFTQRYGGEIGARVAINNRVARLLSGELATTIINTILVVFYVILMLQYGDDPTLTLIGITIALLNIAGLQIVSRHRAISYQRMLQERGKLIGTAMSGLQIIETLKATGSESDFFARWSGHQTKMINAEQQLRRYSQLLSVLPSFLAALNTLAILTIGARQVINGGLTVGELVAFQSLMVSFTAPFNQLVNLGGRLQEAQGDISRLDDVLRCLPDPYVAQGETSLNALLESEKEEQNATTIKLSGQMELRNVTFGYSRFEPALIENFSLSLKPGDRVALVGGSGSGKSTIARLMTGLYEPWSGEILLDGKSRDQLPRHVINNSLAMVDQDVILFEGTIRENLSLWDTTMPEENIVQAAKDAVIHEDITIKPGGYDYQIGEGGYNFSGGQRQRLEIARALAGNPAILVLDEATNALDTKTEQLIDDNLRRRGCTCLIIAHRLSTIRDCDEIIMLDRGKIVQRGTHEEMIRVDGSYARLIESQMPSEDETVKEYVY